jgi:3-oxosteroid 1-dehydrogenase
MLNKPEHRFGRRDILKSAAALSAASVVGATAQAVTIKAWDHEADVVIVGTGAAGMSAAVTACAHGASVILVEARDQVGGTTGRSGGGCWIPNNRFMKEVGLADPRAAALRYMARYSFPQLYDQADAKLGLPANAYDLITAFYDNASPAIDYLDTVGALHMRAEYAYDYWDDAPENRAPYGRGIFPAPWGSTQSTGKIHPASAVTPAWRELNQQLAGGKIGGGGPLMVEQLSTWLRNNGVPVLLSHRAQQLVANPRGEAVGLRAATANGQTVSIRARKAVHFASGGFIFNPELRLNHLRGPSFGGCAVPTSRGDFIPMATDAGARLGNMQNGWNICLILDEAIDDPEHVHSIWHLGGDSMFLVDRFGRRLVNEKLNYGDRNEVFNAFDSRRRQWPNLVLFLIFDQRVKDMCAGLYPYAPAGEPTPYMLSGATMTELGDRIERKLEKYAGKIGDFRLDPSFAGNLDRSLQEYNRCAINGVDEQFGRGATRYDLQWHLRALGAKLVASNPFPNKTMHPLGDTGPYYAVPLVHGHADTNGGPMINGKAQVLRHDDRPIPGLYGAGNCIASPSGRAYWGGGTTLGLALTFGYLAGLNAVREPVKTLR